MSAKTKPRFSISAVGLVGLLVTGLVPAGLSRPVLSPPYSEGKTYKQAPGPFKVDTVLFDWTDAKRGRAVPVKIYFPLGSEGPFPLIIFSHGLGGSREGYEYLGRHWASHGYISLYIQHAGSDDEVWRGQARPLQSMKRAAARRTPSSRT
jgi:predicted dienelactone hydrolase